MAILRKCLPLAAILLSFLAVTTGENQAFPTSVDKGYAFDAQAEFLDLDEYDHRFLQTNNKGSTGTGGSSSQDTSRCNFWCQLKNSMGQTIIGLLLICIRCVFGSCLRIRSCKLTVQEI